MVQYSFIKILFSTIMTRAMYYREQKSVPLPPNHSWMSGYLRKTHFVHFWTTGVWESETGQNVQLLNSAGGIVNLYEYAIQLFIISFNFFILLSFYFFINLYSHSVIYVSIHFHLGIYFTRSVLSSSLHFPLPSFFFSPFYV